MYKHYTSTIPLDLAEKLKEKGMPIEENNRRVIGWVIPTYAEVFDWIMEQDFTFYIDSDYQGRKKIGYSYFLWDSDLTPYYDNGFMTWHEAANKAIETALTLI